MIRAQDRRLVIVPQYFHAVNNLDGLFIKSVQEHNRINRDVAAAIGVPFLDGVEHTFGPTDTYDSCHFTRDGGTKMAQALFEFLK